MRLLFRWKQELAPREPPLFLPVMVDDGASPAGPTRALSISVVAAPPIIVERAHHEIEVELVGGRRVRFARDTDPATVRAMIGALEGVTASRSRRAT